MILITRITICFHLRVEFSQRREGGCFQLLGHQEIVGITVYTCLILMHYLLGLLHLFRLQPLHLRIGSCVLELPAGDFLGKQLVQLLIRPARGFGLVDP